MHSAMPGPGAAPRPARSPGHKAVGITLAPGPGRLSALMIVGVTLAIVLVIGMKTTGGVNIPGVNIPNGISGQPPPAPVPLASSPAGAGQNPGGGGPGSSSPLDPTAAVVTSGAAGPAPSPASSGATSPAVADVPVLVVREAYQAINLRDYRSAYALGLDQPGEPYAQFAAGYANTARVSVRIVAVSGDVVTVALSTRQKNGIRQTFSGTYTVAGGRIVGAQIQQDS